jgi:ferritin-like metal-binding protein YciE
VISFIAKWVLMQSPDSVNEVLYIELEKIYDAECNVMRSLPMLITKSLDKQLKAIVKRCIDTSRVSCSKLEIVFFLINQKSNGIDNIVIRDLLSNCTNAYMRRAEDAKDIFLLGRLQQINLYKITTYDNILFCAEQLENQKVASIIREIISDESEIRTALLNTALSSTQQGNVFIFPSQKNGDNVL